MRKIKITAIATVIISAFVIGSIFGYVGFGEGDTASYWRGYNEGYETAGRDVYCEACYEGYLLVDPDHDNCVETCRSMGYRTTRMCL